MSSITTRSRVTCRNRAVGRIKDGAGATVLVCFDHYCLMMPRERIGFVFDLDAQRIGKTGENCQIATAVIEPVESSTRVSNQEKLRSE